MTGFDVDVEDAFEQAGPGDAGFAGRFCICWVVRGIFGFGNHQGAVFVMGSEVRETGSERSGRPDGTNLTPWFLPVTPFCIGRHASSDANRSN